MIREEIEHIIKNVIVGGSIIGTIVIIAKILWLNGLLESLFIVLFSGFFICFLVLISYVIGSLVLRLFEKDNFDDIDWDT